MPRAYNTRINDVLLVALARVIDRWSGQRACSIDLEGHGREGRRRLHVRCIRGAVGDRHHRAEAVLARLAPECVDEAFDAAGADHRGFSFKKKIIKILNDQKHTAVDMGSFDSVKPGISTQWLAFAFDPACLSIEQLNKQHIRNLPVQKQR